MKKVVKDAIVNEDRGKNLMVFGLSEECEEELNKKVSDILSELNEKPRLEACRVGTSNPENTTSIRPRPVKVALSNVILVRQILSKAKALRRNSKYSSVYLCPDRSPEERLAHKELVDSLRTKINEEPHLHHFIRGSKIHSAERHVP